MPRRRSSRRKSDSAGSAPNSSRKRRRRRSKSKTPATGATAGRAARDGGRTGEKRASHLDLPPLTVGRAPRMAQPPTPNPRIFSYTYTIWKTS